MASKLDKHRLGWIGLGRMGLPIAERLVNAGADLAGYNRTRAKARPLGDAGAALVARPVDLAGRDIVFTMVSAADDLFQVTTGPDGVLADPDVAPRILIDCSTVSERESSVLRKAAAERGTELLVAAVSGNDVVARAGRLRVLSSGPRQTFETALPYLACFGEDVSYVGDGDNARIVKICHNMLLAVTFQTLAEIAVLGEAAGVPRHTTLDVINRSVLGSAFSRYRTPGMVNLDNPVAFTLDLLRKDLALALDAARETGATVPMTAAVNELVVRLIARDGGDGDFTDLLRQQAEDCGLTLAPENIALDDGLG